MPIDARSDGASVSQGTGIVSIKHINMIINTSISIGSTGPSITVSCLSRVSKVDEVDGKSKTILTSRYVRRVPSASMMSMRWHLPYADVYRLPPSTLYSTPRRNQATPPSRVGPSPYRYRIILNFNRLSLIAVHTIVTVSKAYG